LLKDTTPVVAVVEDGGEDADVTTGGEAAPFQLDENEYEVDVGPGALLPGEPNDPEAGAFDNDDDEADADAKAGWMSLTTSNGGSSYGRSKLEAITCQSK